MVGDEICIFCGTPRMTDTIDRAGWTCCDHHMLARTFNLNFSSVCFNCNQTIHMGQRALLYKSGNWISYHLRNFCPKGDRLEINNIYSNLCRINPDDPYLKEDWDDWKQGKEIR